MFRKGERVMVGIEDWRVPESREEMAGPIGVPAKNPRVEQRIAEIARQRLVEVRCKRPGRHDRERDEQCQGSGGDLKKSPHGRESYQKARRTSDGGRSCDSTIA